MTRSLDGAVASFCLTMMDRYYRDRMRYVNELYLHMGRRKFGANAKYGRVEYGHRRFNSRSDVSKNLVGFVDLPDLGKIDPNRYLTKYVVSCVYGETEELFEDIGFECTYTTAGVIANTLEEAKMISLVVK